ncbi:hypothetical protein GGQ97_001174 [Sphingomonas kaistensis]|uniref:Uncharacterized protein n=1 Tax=Sphingomonas kaistensis TaxID=298708 RepID=A0A7X5Y8C5_9SPHN|nr:hypothetical protein [Sphingomonas kaistensis]NJC05381.1 hypothetical protein [Sphingomonas kaistensis]
MAKAVRLAALALLTIPVAAAAQTTNPPAAIVEAAADCWQVVGPAGVDQAALVAKGWKAGELREKTGKAVASPLKFYAKPTSTVVVMVLPNSGACSVVSGVTGLDAYRPVMDLLQTRLKQVEPALKAGRAGKNGAAFLGGGRIALIEPTGTKEQPSVRYTVTAESAAKKGR